MRRYAAILIAIASSGAPAWALDKPIAALPVKPIPIQPAAATALGPAPGSLPEIQSITLSSNSVQLTGPTASVTVTVNSINGHCAADVMVNGQPGPTMYTTDSSSPPLGGGALSYSGTVTFSAPGTYDLVARKSSWVAPACAGQATVAVKVTADPNWPCSAYGFVKQSGGLLGGGQFICAPANAPSKVTPMACPSGSMFFNFSAMFGCLTPASMSAFFKGP